MASRQNRRNGERPSLRFTNTDVALCESEDDWGTGNSFHSGSSQQGALQHQRLEPVSEVQTQASTTTGIHSDGVLPVDTSQDGGTRDTAIAEQPETIAVGGLPQSAAHGRGDIGEDAEQEENAEGTGNSASDETVGSALSPPSLSPSALSTDSPVPYAVTQPAAHTPPLVSLPTPSSEHGEQPWNEYPPLARDWLLDGEDSDVEASGHDLAEGPTMPSAPPEPTATLDSPLAGSDTATCSQADAIAMTTSPHAGSHGDKEPAARQGIAILRDRPKTTSPAKLSNTNWRGRGDGIAYNFLTSARACDRWANLNCGNSNGPAQQEQAQRAGNLSWLSVAASDSYHGVGNANRDQLSSTHMNTASTPRAGNSFTGPIGSTLNLTAISSIPNANRFIASSDSLAPQGWDAVQAQRGDESTLVPGKAGAVVPLTRPAYPEPPPLTVRSSSQHAGAIVPDPTQRVHTAAVHLIQQVVTGVDEARNSQCDVEDIDQEADSETGLAGNDADSAPALSAGGEVQPSTPDNSSAANTMDYRTPACYHANRHLRNATPHHTALPWRSHGHRQADGSSSAADDSNFEISFGWRVIGQRRYGNTNEDELVQHLKKDQGQVLYVGADADEELRRDVAERYMLHVRRLLFGAALLLMLCAIVVLAYSPDRRCLDGVSLWLTSAPLQLRYICSQPPLDADIRQVDVTNTDTWFSQVGAEALLLLLCSIAYLKSFRRYVPQLMTKWKAAQHILTAIIWTLSVVVTAMALDTFNLLERNIQGGCSRFHDGSCLCVDLVACYSNKTLCHVMQDSLQTYVGRKMPLTITLFALHLAFGVVLAAIVVMDTLEHRRLCLQSLSFADHWHCLTRDGHVLPENERKRRRQKCIEMGLRRHKMELPGQGMENDSMTWVNTIVNVEAFGGEMEGEGAAPPPPLGNRSGSLNNLYSLAPSCAHSKYDATVESDTQQASTDATDELTELSGDGAPTHNATSTAGNDNCSRGNTNSVPTNRLYSEAEEVLCSEELARQISSGGLYSEAEEVLCSEELARQISSGGTTLPAAPDLHVSTSEQRHDSHAACTAASMTSSMTHSSLITGVQGHTTAGGESHVSTGTRHAVDGLSTGEYMPAISSDDGGGKASQSDSGLGGSTLEPTGYHQPAQVTPATANDMEQAPGINTTTHYDEVEEFDCAAIPRLQSNPDMARPAAAASSDGLSCPPMLHRAGAMAQQRRPTWPRRRYIPGSSEDLLPTADTTGYNNSRPFNRGDPRSFDPESSTGLTNWRPARLGGGRLHHVARSNSRGSFTARPAANGFLDGTHTASQAELSTYVTIPDYTLASHSNSASDDLTGSDCTITQERVAINEEGNRSGDIRSNPSSTSSPECSSNVQDVEDCGDDLGMDMMSNAGGTHDTGATPGNGETNDNDAMSNNGERVSVANNTDVNSDGELSSQHHEPSGDEPSLSRLHVSDDSADLYTVSSLGNSLTVSRRSLGNGEMSTDDFGETIPSPESERCNVTPSSDGAAGGSRDSNGSEMNGVAVVTGSQLRHGPHSIPLHRPVCALRITTQPETRV